MDAPTDRTPIDTLPHVPLYDVRDGGPEALVEADPARLAAIVGDGLRHYGRVALRLGDAATRRWLERTANPYRTEIDRIADRIGQPGAYLLNMSYEWSCTAGVGADPSGAGNRMLRTLDWPLDGLGRSVVVAWQRGPAGDYANVTWPGFVGVLTAMAPGRFSAAINQPPMARFSASCWLDWLISRAVVWRQSAEPPAHLLRRVFDTCATYDEARALLRDAPICIPAFFTLSGAAPGEGCIIERTEDQAAVHESPTSITNHWLFFDRNGRDRGVDSQGRRTTMESVRDTVGDGLDWVVPPILNETTRLAVVANAARSTLTVQGWEADGPATRPFTLPAPTPAGTA